MRNGGSGSVAIRDPSFTHGGMISAKLVELDAVGAEDGPQDHVQRDPVHRLERPKLLALRPIGAFAQRLLLDDLLVVLDALAVKRRGEQLAAVAVLIPSSANTEPGPKIRLRLGWTLIRSSVLAMNTGAPPPGRRRARYGRRTGC